MLTLDPAKLLAVAVIALVVLGPDKLPAAARRASSLLRDLQRLRASLHEQVQGAVGDHPVVAEMSELRDSLVRLRQQADPRRSLYGAIGDPGNGSREVVASPGSAEPGTTGPVAAPPWMPPAGPAPAASPTDPAQN